MKSDNRCSLCGTPGQIVGADEGTNHFAPVVGRVLELLKANEWDRLTRDGRECDVCDYPEYSGHGPNCWKAEAIRLLEGVNHA